MNEIGEIRATAPLHFLTLFAIFQAINASFLTITKSLKQQKRQQK